MSWAANAVFNLHTHENESCRYRISQYRQQKCTLPVLHTTRHTHDRRLAVDECANRSCYTYYETSTRTKIDGQQQCTRHNIAMKSMGHAMHQSWDSDCFKQTVEQTLCQTTPPCSSSPVPQCTCALQREPSYGYYWHASHLRLRGTQCPTQPRIRLGTLPQHCQR